MRVCDDEKRTNENGRFVGPINRLSTLCSSFYPPSQVIISALCSVGGDQPWLKSGCSTRVSSPAGAVLAEARK